MILVDTDHLSVLSTPGSAGYAALLKRMQASSEPPFGTTVVSIEEMLRGWLALIHRLRDVHQQIPAYERLARLFEFFAGWQIVAFDVRAADEFKRLRKERIRIGSQDLKIASIALVRDALVLSANLGDFRRVPGLRVESWLE